MALSAGRNENESSDMVQTVHQLHVLDKDRDPWNCDGCGKLIYCTDKKGYPTAGAPMPKWGGADYPKVCTLCFQLLAVIDKIYWKSLHDAWKAKRKNTDKLKPGEDYFAS